MTRPVIVGEVLFDRFPDGKKVLGGAPFNVAWNLQALGQRPLFVSAVGMDSLGDEIRASMLEWGIDEHTVQTVGHPTGAVDISQANGEPQYTISPGQAWDHLGLPKVSGETAGAELLYHGSLILRSPESRDTVYQLRRQTACPVFLDLNIRPPHFDPKELPRIITGVTWLKLNKSELEEITAIQLHSKADTVKAARKVLEQFSIRHCLVTLGPDGALWITLDTLEDSGPPPEPEPMRDTVGAGDAFTSIIILGILKNWNRLETLKRAVGFASRVCELTGATVNDRNFYNHEQSKWN